MLAVRNVVFLGASFAGSGAAHYFLRHIYPHLPKDDGVSYRAILVDPSETLYFAPAAPRSVVSGELMPDKLLFLDRHEGFKHYGDEYSFIQGVATSWDPQERTVNIRRNGGDEEVFPYYALVLATGTKTPSPLFALQGNSHHDVQAALHESRAALVGAKRVVVAGGGTTGVEVAGEIGEILNGTPGWFSSRPSKAKAEVTIFTSSDKLLPEFRAESAKQAERYLNRVGVDVQYDTRVLSAEQTAGGKTRVVLNNGSEIDADVYIPAWGLIPMSEYVPERLRDTAGFVKANELTTRVDEAGPRVYAIGDIASYSRWTIPDIMAALPVMATNMKRDMMAAHVDTNAKPNGPDRHHNKNHPNPLLVPIGSTMGVGLVGGWNVPSWVVSMVKGKDYLVGKGMENVLGSRWTREIAWKM